MFFHHRLISLALGSLFVQPGHPTTPFYLNCRSGCDASCGGPVGGAWDGVSAALSADGVHFADEGQVFGSQPPPDDEPEAKKQRTALALGKAMSELVRKAMAAHPKHDLASAKRAVLKHLNECCTACGVKRQRNRCPNDCAGCPLHPDLQNAGSEMKPG